MKGMTERDVIKEGKRGSEKEYKGREKREVRKKKV
jgi:hypothetical protein